MFSKQFTTWASYLQEENRNVSCHLLTFFFTTTSLTTPARPIAIRTRIMAPVAKAKLAALFSCHGVDVKSRPAASLLAVSPNRLERLPKLREQEMNFQNANDDVYKMDPRLRHSSHRSTSDHLTPFERLMAQEMSMASAPADVHKMDLRLRSSLRSTSDPQTIISPAPERRSSLTRVRWGKDIEMVCIIPAREHGSGPTSTQGAPHLQAPRSARIPPSVRTTLPRTDGKSAAAAIAAPRHPRTASRVPRSDCMPVFDLKLCVGEEGECGDDGFVETISGIKEALRGRRSSSQHTSCVRPGSPLVGWS